MTCLTIAFLVLANSELNLERLPVVDDEVKRDWMVSGYPPCSFPWPFI